MNERIENTCYTIGWMVEKLTANDELFRTRADGSQVTKVTFEDVGKGNGFMSKVLKVIFDFANGGHPHAVILKLPHIVPLAVPAADGEEENDDNSASVNCYLHERECDFYERFGNLNLLPLPKIFAIDRWKQNEVDGAILMEYLLESGTMIRALESMTASQLRSVTKVLAKLAAYSLTFSEPELQKYPIPSAYIEMLTKLNAKLAPNHVQTWPEGFAEPFNKIKHLFLKPDYITYGFTGIDAELGIKRVITHGDLWLNNIFWKKSEKGPLDEICAIIDWQAMHTGTVCQDLAAMLVLSTNEQTRKDAEKWIIGFLFNAIESELQGTGRQIPFTIQQMEAAYRRAFVNQAILMFTWGPLLIPEQAPEETRREILGRIKAVLEDAVLIVENDLPEWLDENYVPKSCST